MSKKKYWQSFGELHQTESFVKQNQDEFKEELPLADLDDKGIINAKTPRRDFLKYLGFSTAAAAIAAGCKTPVRKAVPYLQRPDTVIPGVANYYASTYVNGGDVVSVIVKQRDGRPIKIEGNRESKIFEGGTSAQCQASVLDLYDMTRLRYPMQKANGSFKEIPTWDAFDKLVAADIAAAGTKQIVILTATISSPSTLQAIADFKTKFPTAKHVQYDAVSHSGMLLANEASYGKRAIPAYQFDQAKVIVSLGADFLGTWLSPVEFSKQYSKNRKVKGEKADLSRHIQFESMISLTGSNADDRFVHTPSQTGAVALALASKLGVAVSAPSLDANLQKGIDMAATALKANTGKALVVCGSNDMNVQIVVNAINEAIGANGSTINWGATSNYRAGIDSEFETLVKDMNDGNVGLLLVSGVNPVYSYRDPKKIISGLQRTKSVSFNASMDETTEQCSYAAPAHHWLESWGDAEPRSGYISMMQPTINPLFKTRPFETSLLKWSGGAVGDYEEYFKNYWTGKLGGSSTNYQKALQDGFIEMTATAPGASYNSGKLAEAAGKIGAGKTNVTELVLYQKVGMGNGSQANNPWLQELPDPISKVTWDNYAMISPAMAKSLVGLDVMNKEYGKQSNYEVHPEKPVIKVTANGQSLSLPVIVLPGMHPNVIAIAVGYGRQSADPKKTSANIGMAANNAGKNAYILAGFDGTAVSFTAEAKAEKTGDTYPLAQTQVHGFTEERPILFETNISSFNSNPEALLEEPRMERIHNTDKGSTDFVNDATIYPNHLKPGVKWGMSIDLNSCTGCSACVVACTAENNVSVVGKIQVQKAHEMHWLRIDRYFTGDLSNPDVVFQPMLCQHCDNAPCENVCPVAATNHSSEGINQMAYNRCIGTRYCANNCPFKVRRFNWLDYTGADSFPDNQSPLIGDYLNEVTTQMNDDLTRMVLNPDVTVRSRGVMEKCSFCVQRLQDAKLEAKKAQDPTHVRNVQTACSQACPTDAISFGNVNDKESEISRIRDEEQKNRTFYVLDHLHVLPNVSYLAKVRNTERHIGVEEEGTGEHKAEETKAHA